MDLLITTLLLLGLFGFAFWWFTRLFHRFERNVDQQFSNLAEQLNLSYKQSDEFLSDRKWKPPKLEGEIKEGRVTVYIEEKKVGGNRYPKTIIEITPSNSTSCKFKICRKLLATTLLKLSPNQQFDSKLFNRKFIVNANEASNIKVWLDKELQDEFLNKKRDLNNGLLTYDGEILRYEWHYLIHNGKLATSFIKVFDLLKSILNRIN